jgi:hypothetical protein
MRKWTMSACVVVAWCILTIGLAVGMRSPVRPAQAIHRIAISTTQVTLMDFTAAATPAPVARYVVRSGDTLSGIAAALAIPGGWQPLYAANRQAIGPNPNIIRAGAVLVIPRPATRARSSSRAGRHRASAVPPGHARQARHTARAKTRGSPLALAFAMPPWLKAMLLAVGIVIAVALLTELAFVVSRRRPRGGGRRPAVEKSPIILADHHRLIVTYSRQDNTVYVLTPPGEDPMSVLRAARLVVPEEKYQELADHLGVSASWPLE